ncbi:MAG: AraC family transcriptional regulator [Clostridia bacterium]|nr:AraC family transcriptional regulator [Clostridia bacterium]
MTDGKGKITVDNKNYHVKKGDLLIYNSGVTHCEKSNETDPMEILFIAYDKLEITNLPPNSLLPESYGPIFHTEEMYDVFHRYFTALITEFELKERFYMEICQNISRTLIMYIFRLINRTENASALLDKSMTMETVLAYIDENFKRKLTLDEVAEKCYTSKYYLSHLFTRFQGVSIGKYILDKKIDESKKMLASSDFPVVAIAESLGFDDPSYYSRIFKKTVGTTPLQFRKTTSSNK